jgi:hypothetical protein
VLTVAVDTLEAPALPLLVPDLPALPKKHQQRARNIAVMLHQLLVGLLRHQHTPELALHFAKVGDILVCAYVSVRMCESVRERNIVCKCVCVCLYMCV